MWVVERGLSDSTTRTARKPLTAPVARFAVRARCARVLASACFPERSAPFGPAQPGSRVGRTLSRGLSRDSRRARSSRAQREKARKASQASLPVDEERRREQRERRAPQSAGEVCGVRCANGVSATETRAAKTRVRAGSKRARGCGKMGIHGGSAAVSSGELRSPGEESTAARPSTATSRGFPAVRVCVFPTLPEITKQRENAVFSRLRGRCGRSSRWRSWGVRRGTPPRGDTRVSRGSRGRNPGSPRPDPRRAPGPG